MLRSSPAPFRKWDRTPEATYSELAAILLSSGRRDQVDISSEVMAVSEGVHQILFIPWAGRERTTFFGMEEGETGSYYEYTWAHGASPSGLLGILSEDLVRPSAQDLKPRRNTPYSVYRPTHQAKPASLPAKEQRRQQQPAGKQSRSKSTALRKRWVHQNPSSHKSQSTTSWRYQNPSRRPRTPSYFRHLEDHCWIRTNPAQSIHPSTQRGN